MVTGFVTVYNKLIDMFPKHQLFYIVGGFYTVAFALLAAILAHPTIGIANTEASLYRILGKPFYQLLKTRKVYTRAHVRPPHSYGRMDLLLHD